MKSIRIEPYKRWSGGAKALGERAGVLRATNRQVEKHGDFDLIINWGRNERRFNGEYLNEPGAVSLATDKLRSCQAFAEAGVPQAEFTTERDVANQWLQDGSAVLARTMLRASSGRGIVLVDPESAEQLPAAPLYTRYVKKKDEYRVHVFGAEVIDIQKKRRRTEVAPDEADYRIRNAGNGFVYCRNNVDCPDCVVAAATAAVAALGLDFGAVDIGYNRHYENCVVYEVNTAPGLEGSTVDAYFNALREKFPVLNNGAYKRRREVMNASA